MTAEVISFKAVPKDTSAQDIEVIKNFADSIAVVESYNFFYLEATTNPVNIELEMVTWARAVADLQYQIVERLPHGTKQSIKQFADMCREILNMENGHLVGVGVEVTNAMGEDIVWSLMLCKAHEGKYLIRDLICNGRRILVRK